MDAASRQAIIENYRALYRKHGSGPDVAQLSAEGQRFRFEKLAAIGSMTGAKVLDLGCNLGDLYPFLCERYGNIDYTGIDIVPEIISAAKQTHPGARFLCRDVLRDGLTESFDYILISGMFNNAMTGATDFLEQMTRIAFAHCTKAVAFNFISSHVSFEDPGMQYHDPLTVFRYCIEQLTKKVSIFHHYERCDVAVFAYR